MGRAGVTTVNTAPAAAVASGTTHAGSAGGYGRGYSSDGAAWDTAGQDAQYHALYRNAGALGVAGAAGQNGLVSMPTGLASQALAAVRMARGHPCRVATRSGMVQAAAVVVRLIMPRLGIGRRRLARYRDCGDFLLMPAPDVQVFLSGGSTSWSKPSGAVLVHIRCVGGGGGGGSGARKVAGSAVNWSGGAGGGGGSRSEAWFDAADLGSSLTVTVGASGAGGAATTTDDTAGSNGSAGGTTEVLDGSTILLRSATSGGGNSGSLTANRTGGIGGTGAMFNGSSGGTANIGSAGSVGQTSSSAGGLAQSSTGGGAGAGQSTTTTQRNGGAGGYYAAFYT